MSNLLALGCGSYIGVPNVLVKPLTEHDRLLFHVETLLDFIDSFSALQANVTTLLQEALLENDDAPVTIHDARNDIAKLARELRKTLHALHAERHF